MFRQLAMLVCGVLALACGVLLFVDSSASLRAAPTVSVSCSVPDVATTACKAPASLCEGNDVDTACDFYNGSDNAHALDHVETFPKSCLSTTDKKICNTPLRNCSRKVGCKWNAEKTPKCTEVG